MINNLLSNIRSRMRHSKRKGFTLMEMIIVLIVIAIISSVMIPSIVGFIWHGQQINRMNIARTLYISMQNQLTRHILEGNLREALTDPFYARDPDGNLVVNETTGYFELNYDEFDTVAELLMDADGVAYPARDAVNSDFVFSIMIPRLIDGNERNALRPEQESFLRLLDTIIINKEILNEAFLMEVNIRTGVVLSIFYGENLGRSRQTLFEYNADVNDIQNVVGGRGMGAGGYQFADARHQGYYGVDWTGEPAVIELPDIIDIYDGKNSGRLLDHRENVLYAELLIPSHTDSLVFRLDLVSDRSRARPSVLRSDLNTPDPDNPAATGFIIDLDEHFDLNPVMRDANLSEALFSVPPFVIGEVEHLIYYPVIQDFELNSFGIDVGPLYDKYIWVLDCVYGNLFNTLRDHSINRYIDTEDNDPQFIRAALTRTEGANARTEPVYSLTTDHSHFGGELSSFLSSFYNRYTVSSARHLSNIREVTENNTEFRQTENIDLAQDILAEILPGAPGAVTNFRPINGPIDNDINNPDNIFGGTFTSVNATGGTNRPRIINLRIDADITNTTNFPPTANPTDPVNIGLFAVNDGTINGISIFEARITVNGARNANVGAIAGTNNSTIQFASSYADILRGSTQNSNTGGLVGYNATGATIDQSFNAGFFDTHREDPYGNYLTNSNTPYSFGSVRSGAGNIGGLAGSNSGTVSNSYNNARVNVEDIIEMVLPASVPADHPFRLSRGPVPTVTTGAPNIGGIAGINNIGGSIERVYATNYVGAVGTASSSGGIVGRNNAAASSISNAYYLQNGITNDIGTIQTQKSELWNQTGLLGTVLNTRFKAGNIAAYQLMPGDNSYEAYPYPILRNNEPFENTRGEWGWEDIDDIPEGPLVLVYYELYSDGTYGFGPTIMYLPGVSQATLKNDIPVREAGYMLIVEMPEVPDPLTFNVRDENSGRWELVPILLTNLTTAQTGLVGNFYYSVIELSELLLIHSLGSDINRPISYAAAYGPVPGTDPEITGYVHPFFANALFTSPNQTSFEIRTPWQFENINKSVSGDLGGLVIVPGFTFAEYGGNADGATPPGMTATSTHGTVAQRVQRVQDEAQAPGAASPTIPAGSTVIGLGGGRISVNGVETTLTRLNVTTPNVTFTGNFSGISTINVTGATPTFINITASNCSIYVAGAATVNVTQGMHMSNVEFASRGIITVSGTPGPRNVFLDAIFYTTSTTSVNITGATNWSRAAIPQFISQGAATVTMTSPGPNGYISGIFFTNATGGNSIRIDNIEPVASFHGILLSTGNINPQGWAISNANVVVPDSLDPHIRTFLLNTPGWTERPGTKPLDRALTFRQTRDISFGNAEEFDQNPSGDIGVLDRYGNDGTTARIQLDPSINAVVTVGFNAIYQGNNNIVRDLTIDTTENYCGIFASNDGGLIQDLILADSDIFGNNFVGGIAGESKVSEVPVGAPTGTVGTEGVITGCTIRNTSINGIAAVGGITGANDGTIELCIVESSDILGRLQNPSSNIGGITGANYGDVLRCGVQYSTVVSLNSIPTDLGYNQVGGIVGANASTGNVRDVYFLSLNEIDDVPVSNNGGGIVGQNGGRVSYAFYYAPSPSATVGTGSAAITTLYPIVRSGNAAETVPPEDVPNTRTYQTCFFLAGHRYSTQNGEDETWINERYNLITGKDVTPVVRVENGGTGLTTRFIEFEWLLYAYYADISDAWIAPPINVYPYPVLRGLPRPTQWAAAESPTRPDQVDRIEEDGDLWNTQFFTSDRPAPPAFVNGNFTDPFILPEGYTFPTNPSANRGGVDNILIPPYDYMDNIWFSIDMSAINGWYTRPVPESRNLFNSDTPGYFIPFSGAPFNEPFRPGFTTSNIPRWRIIELQAPNGSNDFMRTNYLGQNSARGDIANTSPTSMNVRNSPFRYAELNAESQGTLYQVLPSTPGAQFVYSFYHATRGFNPTSVETEGGMPSWLNTDALRPPASGGDRMHFYLSRVNPDQPDVVESEAYAIVRDNAMRLIRPCESPRSQPTLGGAGFTAGQNTTLNNRANIGLSPPPTQTNVILNPIAWNTVYYDISTQNAPVTGNANGGNYDSMRDHHQGKTYTQPNGRESTQNFTGVPAFYLYDVWIGATSTTPSNGGTRTGFGITFWSQTNFAGQLAVNGYETLDSMLALAPAAHAEAITKTIGYWGVSYGWKHYYGEYTVPSNQVQTEFAFQSRSGPSRRNVGNFLDGVSFKAPAFLSVDMFIRDSSNDEVTFVKPAEPLTVDVNIGSWGDISADNISIDFRLYPFNEYIRWDGAAIQATVTRSSGATSNVTAIGSLVDANVPRPGGIIEPVADGTLRITLPATTRLEKGDSVMVSFGVNVLRYVNNVDGLSTLVYYFKNQAVVNYHQVRYQNGINYNDYLGLTQRVNTNASEVIQVYIDPIRLSKTVTTEGHTSSSPDPLVNGPSNRPFNVKLRAESALITDVYIEADGIINVVIPQRFAITSVIERTDINGTVDLEPNRDVFFAPPDADGNVRMTIRNVIIDDTIEWIEFDYQLRHVGSGYGVTNLSLAANYMYMYFEDDDIATDPLNVDLRFPQPVVGISAVARDDNFLIGEGESDPLNITGNDNFAIRYADNNYDVTPRVIFTNSSGAALTVTDYAGNDRYETSDYIATMIRETWRLVVEPKPGRSTNEFEIYYKIDLTASREGATPPAFDLTSQRAMVTVTVDSLLVYYEEYSDGSYGFYSAGGLIRNSLIDTLDIIDSGYGVLSSTNGRDVQLDGATVACTVVPMLVDGNAMFLYEIPTIPTDDFTLQSVGFGATGRIYHVGWIHPNFAKAVYQAVGPPAPDAGTSFSIRTQDQMDSIEEIIAFVGVIPIIGIDFNGNDTITYELTSGVTYTFTIEIDGLILIAPFSLDLDFYELELCPECENELEFDEEDDFYECPSCGWTSPIATEPEPCDICDELPDKCVCEADDEDVIDEDVVDEDIDDEDIIDEDIIDEDIVDEELTLDENKDEKTNDDDTATASGAVIDEPNLEELSIQSDITSDEDAIIIINIVSLFSGYGLTKTKIIKNYIRKSNARAIRKINEHNDRKRGTPGSL